MAGPDTSTHHRQLRRPGAAAAVAFDRPFRGADLQGLRQEAAACADRLGVPLDRLENLLLVVSELTTNAVRHGGGTGRLRLWSRGQLLYCQVSDRGDGTVPPDAGTEPPDPLATDGRGIWICRQVCTELIISGHPQGSPGTTVIAVMRLDLQPADADDDRQRDQRPPHSIRRPTVGSDRRVSDPRSR